MTKLTPDQIDKLSAAAHELEVRLKTLRLAAIRAVQKDGSYFELLRYHQVLGSVFGAAHTACTISSQILATKDPRL